MNPEVFGKEHILYIIISLIAGGTTIFLAKKLAKTEKSKQTVIRILASLLFVAIMTNRLSQVFRYDQVRWYCIIPDSFCGLTSLLLSLAGMLGRKNNPIYHSLWLLGLFGGISTVIYATFVGQSSSIFYIPTISGLLHHSLCAMLVVALLMFRQIDITYKKWYYTFFGFTCYLTLGAFLMHTFKMSDAFHIAEPLLSDTPLTVWVMAPMYAFAYAIILLAVELINRKKHTAQHRKNEATSG